MFSKADRELRKVRRAQMKERNSKLYNGWDIGEMGSDSVTKDGVTYYIDRPSYRVIDDYDAAIGSVELSHRVAQGYAVVEGYDGDTDKLDFTFIKPQDAIKVDCDEKIKTVRVNASNLRSILFNVVHPLHVIIVVDTNKIDTLLGVKLFLKNHKDMIKDIEYIYPKKTRNKDIDDMLSEDTEKEKKEGKSK